MRHATLLELTLAEQEARNAAAIAAIRARSTDIIELQRLVESLAARDLHVRAAVSTQPIGAQAVCRLEVWLSCTLQELTRALEWLVGADINVARVEERDHRTMRTYQLTLRGQTIQLNVTLHEQDPIQPYRFQPAAA
jgi:hypothetical protein